MAEQRLDGRCGECENCKKIDRIRGNMLRVFNPHYTDNYDNIPNLVPGREAVKDDAVQMWNEALCDWPCTGKSEETTDDSH